MKGAIVPPRQLHQINEQWAVETSDDPSIFVRYRGVDVIGIWAPPPGNAAAYIEVADPRAIVDDDELIEEGGNPEWGHGRVVDFRQAVEAVDEAHLRAQFTREMWRQDVAAGFTEDSFAAWRWERVRPPRTPS